jgi:hypothetical protein
MVRRPTRRRTILAAVPAVLLPLGAGCGAGGDLLDTSMQRAQFNRPEAIAALE